MDEHSSCFKISNTEKNLAFSSFVAFLFKKQIKFTFKTKGILN